MTEERLENVERILLLKYGTLDYDTIKKRDDENTQFYQEMNERAKKINEKLDAMAEKTKDSGKQWDEFMERSKERTEKLKELLNDS